MLADAFCSFACIARLSRKGKAGDWVKGKEGRRMNEFPHPLASPPLFSPYSPLFLPLFLRALLALSHSSLLHLFPWELAQTGYCILFNIISFHSFKHSFLLSVPQYSFVFCQDPISFLSGIHFILHSPTYSFF